MGLKKTNRPTSSKDLVLGIAWYRPEDWSRLRRVSADPEILEETYEEWRAIAEKGERELPHGGVTVVRVEVDLDELVEWCRAQGRPVDAAARAEFTSRKVRDRYGSETDRSNV